MFVGFSNFSVVVWFTVIMTVYHIYKYDKFLLQFMTAWTWYTGVRTSGRSQLLLMRRNFRLSSDGADMICRRVKHSSLSHSINSPWRESGTKTSTDAWCWLWTLHRSLSSSVESTVNAVPSFTVKFSKVNLEQLVKVNGRLDSSRTGLRVIISSTEL